ncbi:MAG: signal recognition particle-docking protein FtsY [Armatimonadota bacterium]|jgi:fused signal recognition particle receptor|nr:signal recognition particle-docking protein FtsY [Armatimonadota bacterium]MDT7971811.1 signal recognition particle-docking protein FtsY [Armatimonadota bacterium]
MRFLRNLVQRVTQLFQRPAQEVDETFLDELEEALILADVGVVTTEKLMAPLRDGVKRRTLKTTEEVRTALRDAIVQLLGDDTALRFAPTPPTVWLFVGVNGTGKTTTVAKLARWAQKQGHKPLLVAADTFRAAAIDQLKIWGDRLRIPVIAHQMGADPAAVAFDGVQAAKARGNDLVLIDTAGRMHTKFNLLEEMRKIYRSVTKALERQPDEVLLVLDGTAGQNAIAQAESFRQAIPITGIIVTKLDGTAKGGAVLAIRDRFAIPIKAIGVGETADDLDLFDPHAFATAMVGEKEEKAKGE